MAEEFRSTWKAEVLQGAPLIAPARQFVYPTAIPGEEDALARGALRVQVRPRAGGVFLANFALGFRDPSMPTGVHPAPGEDELCALAGGYGYLLDTVDPGRCTLLPLKPVTAIFAAPEAGLLVFAGFQIMLGWEAGGIRWQTGRLSWDGVRVTEIRGETLHGFGWDLMADQEVPFTVDLRTGDHQGGAAPGRA